MSDEEIDKAFDRTLEALEHRIKTDMWRSALILVAIIAFFATMSIMYPPGDMC